jgi:diguanylate cyclase (GGDEF)-like protein
MSPVIKIIIILIAILAVNPSVFASPELEQITALREIEPDQAVKVAESLWKANRSIPVGIELLKSYLKAEQTEKTIEFSKTLLALKNLTPEQINEAYRARLVAMKTLKRWDEQEKVIEHVLINTEKLTNKVTQSAMYALIARIKYAQFKMAETENYFQKAIDIGPTEASAKLAELYSEQGIAKAQQGKFSDAMETMLSAFKMYQSIGDEVPLGIYNNIGGLSIYIKDWKRAIEFLNKAIDATPIDTFNKSYSYSNLGVAYLSNQEPENAYKSFQRSLAITDKLGKENPSALSNIGALLKEQGQYTLAIESFERISKIYMTNGEKEDLGVAKKNLGDIWVALDDRKKAATYFDDAYQLYQEKNYRPKLIELYPVMIDNLQQLGEYAKALNFALEFKSMNDEMVNVESKEKIADLQSAFELEKKNKELLASEKELSDLESEQVRKDKEFLELQLLEKEQRSFNFALLFTVIALSAAGFVLLRINRFRSKTNQVLQEKNQQIESNHIELQSLNEQLRQQSLEDSLTGLKNRRYLEQFLDKDIARLNRLLTDDIKETSLIIMLDLDKFKVINDTYGHSVGDQVLCAFSSVLKQCGRESDIQVRWGGEEFLWYCPDTPYSEGAHLCERVQLELAKISIPVEAGRVKPTCSFGFVEFPVLGSPNEDWDKSLKIADAALYEAKDNGRDSWVGAEVLGMPDIENKSQVNVNKLIDSGCIRLNKSE